PVTLLHAQIAKSGRNSGDLCFKLAPGECRDGGVLLYGGDRHSVRRRLFAGEAKQILGEVDSRIGIPLRSRHGVQGKRRLSEAVADDREVLTNRTPEAGEVVDGPLPKVAVPLKMKVPRGGEPFKESFETAATAGRPGNRSRRIGPANWV